MAIKPLLLSVLEAALNQALMLDPNRANLLSPLNGKVIAVTLLPFNETFFLCPSTESIQWLDDYPMPADTHLTGSVWAFGLMGLSGRPMRSVFSGEVVIEGDMQTGRKFQALFAHLNLDLESQLARFTGAGVAEQLGNLFRAGRSWSAESLETCRLNVAEFLQDETRDLPSAPEIDIFYHQVDELRLSYDRLSRRMDDLEAYIIASKTK